MSREVRTELAEAASEVFDCRVKPYYEQSTRAGDGWVRLDGHAADDTGFGYMSTWQVCLVLDQDQGDAEKWVDDHTDDLLAALKPCGHITNAAPYQLSIGGATLPAFIVTLIRAKE